MKKTGSKVKAVKKSTPYLGLPCWTVEYLDGSWSGKTQVASERALVSTQEESNAK